MGAPIPRGCGRALHALCLSHRRRNRSRRRARTRNAKAGLGKRTRAAAVGEDAGVFGSRPARADSADRCRRKASRLRSARTLTGRKGRTAPNFPASRPIPPTPNLSSSITSDHLPAALNKLPGRGTGGGAAGAAGGRCACGGCRPGHGAGEASPPTHTPAPAFRRPARRPSAAPRALRHGAPARRPGPGHDPSPPSPPAATSRRPARRAW
jgi:hypothetical protein